MVTSDVIGTPHLQVTIYKLSLASMFSIANFREALSQFPFFLMAFLCYEYNCVVGPPMFHCLCILQLWVTNYEKQDSLVPFVLDCEMQF